MTLKPRTALTASPSQKSQKYAVSMRVSQSGNVMAKLATCARRNKKNTGNCLCSLRRHKITATTDCRVGCAHHKERTMVWLCKVMADAAVKNATNRNRRASPSFTSSGTMPRAVNPGVGNLSNHYPLPLFGVTVTHLAANHKD